MATKAQREEIAERTDRVRELTAAGSTGEAAELVKDTEDLIRSTRPIRDHDGYLKLLGDAASPVTDVSTADYHAIEGMDVLIEEGAKRVRSVVDAGIVMGDAAREVASTLLSARIKMRNRAGLPDLISTSKHTKNVASEMFAKAREHLAENDTERQLQHDAVAKTVRNRMQDILVEYLRALDNSPEEMRTLYPQAALQFPTLTPTEAVYALYEREGFQLPRRTRAEVQQEYVQKQRELAVEAGAKGANRTPAPAFEMDDLLRVTRVVHTAVSRAEQMSKPQRTKLKKQINQAIEALEAEAAKL